MYLTKVLFNHSLYDVILETDNNPSPASQDRLICLIDSLLEAHEKRGNLPQEPYSFTVQGLNNTTSHDFTLYPLSESLASRSVALLNNPLDPSAIKAKDLWEEIEDELVHPSPLRPQRLPLAPPPAQQPPAPIIPVPAPAAPNPLPPPPAPPKSLSYTELALRHIDRSRPNWSDQIPPKMMRRIYWNVYMSMHNPSSTLGPLENEIKKRVDLEPHPHYYAIQQMMEIRNPARPPYFDETPERQNGYKIAERHIRLIDDHRLSSAEVDEFYKSVNILPLDDDYLKQFFLDQAIQSGIDIDDENTWAQQHFADRSHYNHLVQALQRWIESDEVQ